MNMSNESSIDSNVVILNTASTTINLVLGVPINSWVLWLVLTGPAGTMASDFFTLNLSVCELISSLLYLIILIKEIPLLEYFHGGFLYTGHPVFQSCIGVERFMAVVHPVLFLKYKPLRYRVACSALAWPVVIGFSLLHMLLDSAEVSYFIHVGKNLCFVAVMLYCSLAVLRVLKQPMPGETGRERERDDSMKKRAFAIICACLVSFLVASFIWILTIFFYASQGQEWWYNTLMIHICKLISVVIGFVQPLLYLYQKTGKLPCITPTQGQGT